MSPSKATQANPSEFKFGIVGMDCASCARTIEHGIKELSDVDEVQVNFTTESMQGRGTVSLEALRKRVESLGYRLVDRPRSKPLRSDTAHGLQGFLKFVWRHGDTRITLLLGALVFATLPIQLTSTATAAIMLVTGLHWVVIGIVGYNIANRGLRSLFYAHRITIDLLMTVATLGAVGVGASGEAVTVVLLFSLGEALEGFSAARSRDSLHALLSLQPSEATIIRSSLAADGASRRHYEQLPVSDLVPGDLVLVKPGERIGADGRIASGASGIDESAITGESLPIYRQVGDEVFASTINGAGTLEIEVSRRADEFAVAQIARLVEQAQNQRSPAERFVDRFAQWYTPAVVLLAFVVAIVPPLAFGQPLLSSSNGAPGWLYRGLALLIVACPCALIISIPVTVVSTLTRLATLGVLVKGGAQLDILAGTKAFAFDKTGTLTHGRPVVLGARSGKCDHGDIAVDDCLPCDEMLAMAAAVERGAAHPMAHAVLEAASERKLEHRYPPATNIVSHAGRGVSGNIEQRRVTIGHEALFQPSEDVRAILNERASQTNSLMLVAEEDRVLGYIEVADGLRGEARSALQQMKSIAPGIRLVMLTGDRREVATSIAEKLELIDAFESELMPQDKLDAVRRLESEYGSTAMVGDGINDTPALAGASLGIAMGAAGSHQAIEVADIVLMQDHLSQLPRTFAIARKAKRLIHENIALSLGLKLAFLALAIPGIATLWMAVLADVGATVLVTLNGMRMLRAR